MKTIKQLIEQLAKVRSASLHIAPFAPMLAEIQDALGQDDGGNAGMFFSEYEDNCWQWMAYDQKIAILKSYVSRELDFVVDEDDDSDVVVEVCRRCHTPVTGEKDQVSDDYVRACTDCDEDLFGFEVLLMKNGEIIQRGIDTSEEEV